MSRSQRETILVTASADGPPFRRSPNPKNLSEPTGVLSAMATIMNGYRGSRGALQRPAEAARIARSHAVHAVECIPSQPVRGDKMSDDASRARAASEERPIVAWLVQEAGGRPCRRCEPSRVAVSLEPREGSGEDRECGDECRAHDQKDDQPPVSPRSLKCRTRGRSRHLPKRGVAPVRSVP